MEKIVVIESETFRTNKLCTTKSKEKENKMDIFVDTGIAEDDADEILILEEIINYPNKNKKKKLHQCSYCVKSFSKIKHLKSHTKTHTGEPLQCSLCDKAFSYRNHLKTHFKTHSGEKPYQLSECDKSLLNNSDLNLTIHQCKLKVDTYQCIYCKEMFYKNSQLKTHTQTYHVKQPYHCNQCDKSFSQDIYLKCHMRTHTGEKPYQCTQCNLGFSQYNNLVSHSKTHIGEKPYQCKEKKPKVSEENDIEDFSEILIILEGEQMNSERSDTDSFYEPKVEVKEEQVYIDEIYDNTLSESETNVKKEKMEIFVTSGIVIN